MNSKKTLLVTTHPIQYQAPLFTELAKITDIHVLFLTKSTAINQSESGFDVKFEWDIPLFEGYNYSFAENISKNPSPNTKEGILLKNPAQLIDQHSPALIILFGWYTKAHQQIIKTANRNKIPLIIRGESTLIMDNSPIKKFIKRFYLPYFFKKFQHFLSIGKENTLFYNFYGIPNNKITLAPYSINTPLFLEGYRAPKTERKANQINIGFSGKFIDKKRPLDLILAVANSKYKTRIKLLMIGDGPLMASSKIKAQELEVAIDFLGFLNQSEIIKKGYSNMDMFVLPSGDYETWGLVVNEAMTGGLPVIVSHKVGCHSDLVDDNTGAIFESGNILQLSKKIEEMIEKIDNHFPYQKNVLEKISKYSLSSTVQGFNTAIKNILNEN